MKLNLKEKYACILTLCNLKEFKLDSHNYIGKEKEESLYLKFESLKEFGSHIKILL